MLTISYLGLAMGILFAATYGVSTPFIQKYKGVETSKLPKWVIAVAVILMLSGILNLLMAVIVTLFSLKLTSVLFGVLLFVSSAAQVITDKRTKTLEPEDIKFVDWLIFSLMLVFTMILRTLPFIAFIWL